MTLEKNFKQAEKAADKLTQQAEKELVKAYRDSLKEIRAQLALAYEKYAADGTLTMAEMMKYGRLVKLEEAIAKEVSKVTGTETKTTKKAIKNVFQESYYRSAWAMETGAETSLGFTLLKPEAIEAAILNPMDRISWPERVKDNAKMLNRQIREEITRGIIQGYSYDKTARAVKERMDVGASKAIRIVQTETHRAQSQGTQAAFERAAAKGLVFKRVWVATLDGRTRDRHRTLDGQKVDVDQPFEYGGMTAMYPGGFGIASMDINCRCSVRAEIEGMEPQLRRARDPATGKNVVIGNTTYEDWANGKGIQLQLPEPVPKKPRFVPAKTVKEAEEYARKNNLADNVSYGRIDVEAANEWNKAIYETLDKFPGLRPNFEFIGSIQQRNAKAKTLGYTSKRIPKNYWAVSTTSRGIKGISINAQWAKNIEAFKQSLAASLRDKYHPVGCDTIKSVADHELGHQLDDLLNISGQQNIRDLFMGMKSEEITEGLSRYAWQNTNARPIREFVAEGWAEYCNNPNPRPLAKEIGETIERRYKEWANK